MTHILSDLPKPAPSCPCGSPGTVYDDNGRVALCGRCWWAIYGADAGDGEVRDG